MPFMNFQWRNGWSFTDEILWTKFLVWKAELSWNKKNMKFLQVLYIQNQTDMGWCLQFGNSHGFELIWSLDWTNRISIFFCVEFHAIPTSEKRCFVINCMPFLLKKSSHLLEKKIREEIKKKKKVIQKERNKIANFDSMVLQGQTKETP